MSNLFDLNIVDKIEVDELYGSESFNEFSYNLKLLERLYSEPILEEVIDHETNFRHGVSKIVSNTKDTTKDVFNAYNKVTDANAGLIKNTWNLIIKALDLIIKISTFIIRQIAKIPMLIIKTLNKIMEIPSNIRNKIKGNIKLYITAKDIENLYNQSLLIRIDSFIQYATMLAKGDVWNTLFGVSAKRSIARIIEMKPSDTKLCKQMKKLYTNMANMEFKPTVIEMSIPSVVNTYFGDEKSIQYIWKGKRYKSNYYDALKGLIENLNTQVDSIKVVQQSINEKIDRTYANSQYARLGLNAQRMINEAIQEIAKVICIIGNIMKYIVQDMKTMETTADSIINKSAKSTKKLSN